MGQPADPGHGALQAHAEARVLHAAEASHVQVLVVVGEVEAVMLDLGQQVADVG